MSPLLRVHGSASTLASSEMRKRDRAAVSSPACTGALRPRRGRGCCALSTAALEEEGGLAKARQPGPAAGWLRAAPLTVLV
eukprot:10250509-Alexandrium_andersonii.AAC.1